MRFKKKILLIEDDLVLGSSIVEILSFNNFQVEWFKDGAEALKILRRCGWSPTTSRRGASTSAASA